MAINYNYNYGFLDEDSKKEIRRATIKALAIPGYQVPFASRELPIARGWGTGGLQLTLSLIGKEDTLKVIDQGADDSVNAINLKKLISNCTDVNITTDTEKATLIQTRHRVPETPMKDDQILILQVPIPEPLREIEGSEKETKKLHADAEYSGVWLSLYEDIIKYDDVAHGADYPTLVNDRYIMSPSPIPKYDNSKLHMSETLYLFGAGREKKIYAIPPYTNVVSLAFEDFPFKVENFENKSCNICGAINIFLDEVFSKDTGKIYYQCSDTDYCKKRKEEV